MILERFFGEKLADSCRTDYGSFVRDVVEAVLRAMKTNQGSHICKIGRSFRIRSQKSDQAQSELKRANF